MRIIELQATAEPDSGGAADPRVEAWIDIGVSDDEGREWLASRSGLDDAIVGRLTEPTSATYWRRFGRGLHLNVHAPVPGETPATIAIVALGIWLEPGRIITVHHGAAPALDRAAEACSTGAGPGSSWELILFLLSAGLSRVERDLHELIAEIEALEDEVLSGEGDAPLHRIAELQKRLIYARRFRMPLASLLSFVSAQPGSVIVGVLRDELEGIVNAVAQHRDLLDFSLERALALQGRIRDQLADSMNTATYRFTWVATVFLPLGFLTGLLGINVAGIPGDHNPLAFWLVCGTLGVVAAAWGVLVGRVTSPFRKPTRRD